MAVSIGQRFTVRATHGSAIRRAAYAVSRLLDLRQSAIVAVLA